MTALNSRRPLRRAVSVVEPRRSPRRQAREEALAAAAPHRRRLCLRSSLGAGGLRTATTGGRTGRFMVSTDDAYVGADAATIAPKITGYVKSVPVSDNAQRQGRRSAGRARRRRLPHRAAARPRRRSRPQKRRSRGSASRSTPARPQVTQAEAQLASAKAAADNAKAEFDRANALAAEVVRHQVRRSMPPAPRCCRRKRRSRRRGRRHRGEGERRRWSRRRRPRPSARSTSTGSPATRRSATSTTRSCARRSTASSATVRSQSATSSRRASGCWRSCRSTHVYVDANFKETQIAELEAGPDGRRARSTPIPDRDVTGTVESIAPASGSVFSLLPPENATGNFTKIVQRVPVRIRLPGDVAAEG